MIVFERLQSLSNVSTYSRRALHRLCSASKLLCCAASTFFCISSMRHVASFSSSFLSRNASSRTPSLSPSLSSSFSSVAALSCIVCKSASLFALSLPLLFHVISFTIAWIASYSAETSFHLPFGFACSRASGELCPPPLLAGCCHLVFVVPCHSLLFHLSLFSVIAFFRTAVVFSTLDSLLLLWDEHEDDRDILCTVPELKGFRFFSFRSSLLSSSSSPPAEEEEVQTQVRCWIAVRPWRRFQPLQCAKSGRAARGAGASG